MGILRSGIPQRSRWECGDRAGADRGAAGPVADCLAVWGQHADGCRPKPAALRLLTIKPSRRDADTHHVPRSPRLTLLHCVSCGRDKAHIVERVEGVLTFTCRRCRAVT